MGSSAKVRIKVTTQMQLIMRGSNCLATFLHYKTRAILPHVSPDLFVIKLSITAYDEAPSNIELVTIHSSCIPYKHVESSLSRNSSRCKQSRRRWTFTVTTRTEYLIFNRHSRLWIYYPISLYAYCCFDFDWHWNCLCVFWLQVV